MEDHIGSGFVELRVLAGPSWNMDQGKPVMDATYTKNKNLGPNLCMLQLRSSQQYWSTKVAGDTGIARFVHQVIVIVVIKSNSNSNVILIDNN